MFSSKKHLIVVASMLMSGFVQATPLSDFNLILTGDYNYQGGEVEGRTLLGGNLNAAGHSPTFATRETTVPNKDTVTIVGDVNAGNINLNAGSLSYGGSYNLAWNVNLNGGGSSVQSVTAGNQIDMQAAFDDVETELRNDSAYFASLSSNAVLNGSQLLYSGADSVAVFDLDFSQVFAQNSSLSLDAGTAETVVINVSGSDVTVGGGVNLTNGFGVQAGGINIGAANILWNFYEADSIDFNNLATVGSVLALDADITGGAVFDGSVAAKSYTGAREFHSFGFDWTTPQVPAVVSEGSTTMLFAFGLVFLALSRRKTRI
ncbi:choice-of-anchor A family protein [Agarivorans sp. 1_MG-2023]|uniref:choice-of-anchor A family protein n=1 Tax=Agarivorans sp. 1_MG-2023 TaxID=3062634 RepID=UPI0026E20165|nr:choice-of-anchor A family protein [Agarivorans sp. 1_MG-2023]MDO6763317.1 choice-of-anchor A family protein [Agarivorans sp. 1_MG-2023]